MHFEEGGETMASAYRRMGQSNAVDEVNKLSLERCVVRAQSLLSLKVTQPEWQKVSGWNEARSRTAVQDLEILELFLGKPEAAPVSRLAGKSFSALSSEEAHARLDQVVGSNSTVQRLFKNELFRRSDVNWYVCAEPPALAGLDGYVVAVLLDQIR
jgi:hypothetical protein